MNYYQQLYSNKNVPAIEINSYFESLDSVNINNFESNSCEGDITAIECDKILSELKNKINHQAPMACLSNFINNFGIC